MIEAKQYNLLSQPSELNILCSCNSVLQLWFIVIVYFIEVDAHLGA